MKNLNIITLIASIQALQDNEIVYPEEPLIPGEVKIGNMEMFELKIFTKIQRIAKAHKKEHAEFNQLTGLSEDVDEIKAQKILQRKDFSKKLSILEYNCAKNQQKIGLLYSILWDSVHERIGHYDKMSLRLCKDGIIVYNPEEEVESRVKESLEMILDSNNLGAAFYGQKGEA